MNKKIKEYISKYSNIPDILQDRLIYLLDKINIKIKDIDKIKNKIIENRNINIKELNFIFYFFPQATPRPRYSKFTKVFYVKNLLNYNELFKQVIDECDDIDFIIDTPCEFYCKTYFPIPNQMNKSEQILAELGLIHNLSKPDFDNLAKTYSDMIQKHLLIDDSIIYKGTSEKAYSCKPRIEITIRYLENHDSLYNKRKTEKWKRKEG